MAVSVLVISSGDIISGLKNQNRRGADYGNQKGSYTNRKFLCSWMWNIIWTELHLHKTSNSRGKCTFFAWMAFPAGIYSYEYISRDWFYKNQVERQKRKASFMDCTVQSGDLLYWRNIRHQSYYRIRKRSFSCVYSGCIRYAQRVFLKTWIHLHLWSLLIWSVQPRSLLHPYLGEFSSLLDMLDTKKQ